MRYFRDLLKALLRVLEKFSIDDNTLVSHGLLRDRHTEHMQRQFEQTHRYSNIEYARNDRNNEK